MRAAIECAGFSPGEADQLRRAMATFKHTGGVSKFGQKLIAGMVANGYEPEFAEKTSKQLEGLGSYGFPESHAASFALIAYASAWLKCWLVPACGSFETPHRHLPRSDAVARWQMA
ncbi:Putative DNA polymerase III, alpha subunit [Rhizobium freirei PRF 81]|uniref:Putative DNA polymerase III, alpha subunit n=1 Tax=Rhizobium freirei PRF 81 TaxID=363754 RepID=N6U7F8_9HYPH|nr:Putative DNA polymerase III, alpha subunit [Rhizobium freirei PRF 81]